MRLSKVMGLAVIIVALAAVMNAMAYKTATVTNPTSFTVTSTTGAALAFSKADNEGTGFQTSVPDAGSNQRQLQIIITDNMQPGSVYKFTNVFSVTNAISGAVVDLTYSPDALGQGITVQLLANGVDLKSTTLGGTSPTSVAVDMIVTVSGSYTGTGGSNVGLSITGTQK